MAESGGVLEALKLIQKLPNGLHLYCPRQSREDMSLCFEEDLRVVNKAGDPLSDDPAVNEELVKETRARQDLVTDALEIFAYPSEEPKRWLEGLLTEQLGYCDICVREFHRARRKLKQKLMSQYDVEEVLAFMHIFDKLNVERIERGLEVALSKLESAPEKERGIKTLEVEGTHCVFEALNCKPFLSSDEELDTHFATFFRVLQTNKSLKLGGYTPAMTWFIFGNDDDRRKWASKEWNRFKKSLVPIEFEHCVQDALLLAISRVQLDRLDINFLRIFWDGVQLILAKTDKELYTHSVRAMDGQGMESDLCRLAHSHLQVDNDAFKPLLISTRHILQKSPADFWDALGTVSPQAWLDQFFASKALSRLMRLGTPPLDELFGWMLPFIKSIKPVNQPPTTHIMVSRLLGRFHTDDFPVDVKDYCAKVVINILRSTLSSLIDIVGSDIARSMALEALKITTEHIRTLVPFAKRTVDDSVPAADLLYQALSLDLKCFITVKQQLDSSGSAVQPSLRWTPHTSIWRQAATCLDFGNIRLARKMLYALQPLSGVELYTTKFSNLPPFQKAFNDALQSLKSPISYILDQIQTFNRSDLELLYKQGEAAHSILLLLFSWDGEVRAATMDLLKSQSDQDTRKDTLDHLVRKHYATTLLALQTALDEIAEGKCFACAASTLKVLSDVIEIMCNEQDGFLRSESLSAQDAKATSAFWSSTWKLLKTMFLETQKWNQNGHDKNLLMNFCREAMEFADKAFDQFGVLAGALKSSHALHGSEDENDGKTLIFQPRQATNAAIEWLKLRDDVLVAKSCALVCKLLTRLKEFDQRIGEDRVTSVLEIIVGTSKSTLTGSQKAELARALEIHADIRIENDEASTSSTSKPPKPLRSQVIDLDTWTSKAGGRPKKSSAEIDNLLDSVAPNYRKLREERDRASASNSSRTTAQLPTRTAPYNTLKSQGNTVSTSEFLRKREEQRQEKRRIDAANAAALKKRAYGQANSLVGEGTGARGVGIIGKMHNEAKGEGMMVSDESSSSSEDEEITELDRELFGIGEKRKLKSQKGLTTDQATALRMQRRGPVKKQRIQRSKNQDRARLAPDLGPFHKEILLWNYFHDGNFPPRKSASDYTAVLKTFRDPFTYQNTFSPLLMLEAWNQFLKAKEENTSLPYEIKVTLRSNVDAFLEISTTMSHANGREVGEGDIVLLSKSSKPTSSPNEPSCLVRIGKVNRSKKAHIEVTYRAVPGTPLAPSLSVGSNLYGVKITSIVPIEREYGALDGLKYYDLCQEIIAAEPSPILEYKEEAIYPLMKTYNVNRAQAKAIKSAVDNDGFTLIQGPPGSGKTKTIVAIAGALLTSTLQALMSSGSTKQKMLVCAPSNAAVDELVMRFKQGVKLTNGELRKVSIVRLGRSDAINSNVIDVTLDELVNKKLNVMNKGDSEASMKNHKLFMEHRDISEQLRTALDAQGAVAAGAGPSKQEEENLFNLRRRKRALGEQIDALKDDQQQQMKQADANFKRAQQEVLDGAHVICATLSGSGHDMFKNLNIEFETVIIDEAAQCVELSALIPLKYGCAKCILVGDPQQLPPTVFSKDAAQYKYEQSLFVRMQGNHPKDVHLLDTQYRMHPEISAFPSEAFYDSRLLDGPGMASLRAKPWHGTGLLSPYRFFDVQGQHQAAPKGHSLINLAEINIAILLYRRIITDFGSYDFKGKIGIITPYKSQLVELKRSFQSTFGAEVTNNIEFNTTDAFQGRESEIIIFSCVRASPSGGIGFLRDIRRMNVGLTRAKSSLWVLGNSQSLMSGAFWAKLVHHSQKTNRYTTGHLEGILREPLRMVREVQEVRSSEVKMLPGSGAQRKSSTDAMDVDVDMKQRDFKKDQFTTNTMPQPIGAATQTLNKPLAASNPITTDNIFARPSFPTKRKLSLATTPNPQADTAPIMKRTKVATSVVEDEGEVNNSDVEMTDASTSDTLAFAPAIMNGNAANSAARIDLPPALPRKKKEISIFMKKKPRRPGS